MNKKVKILVCAHKKDYVKNDDIYMPVHAGKALSNIDLGFQGDDTGDNISTKNPNYCELTVLYWAWKNLKDVDYIGLNHYRRYFNFSRFTFKDLEILSVENFLKTHNNTFDLNRHLGKYDIILAKPKIYACSLEHDYSICHYSDDCRLIEKIIKDHYPDYFDAFNKIMKDNNKLSHYNMFITKWKIFDDYCNWLFPILKKIELQRNMSYYNNYQARMLAFIAERLFMIYVFKNKLTVKYYPIRCLKEEVKNQSLFRYVINYIRFNLSFILTKSPSEKIKKLLP
jgi:hypothetical protein